MFLVNVFLPLFTYIYKKDHLIKWDVVCRPKELGGLGFGKTFLRNNALLGKWLWRFLRERNSLWHQVIVSIYGTS